ncbi:hypothetical protein DL98DRAFT_520097 [Cadophora sp. DSE1049]|nr:hypothetical protein DL98DRAFT_520097 [Cadophora sp. DSE1049]
MVICHLLPTSLTISHAAVPRERRKKFSPSSFPKQPLPRENHRINTKSRYQISGYYLQRPYTHPKDPKIWKSHFTSITIPDLKDSCNHALYP